MNDVRGIPRQNADRDLDICQQPVVEKHEIEVEANKAD
jgi:hypothetical protein